MLSGGPVLSEHFSPLFLLQPQQVPYTHDMWQPPSLLLSPPQWQTDGAHYSWYVLQGAGLLVSSTPASVLGRSCMPELQGWGFVKALAPAPRSMVAELNSGICGGRLCGREQIACLSPLPALTSAFDLYRILAMSGFSYFPSSGKWLLSDGRVGKRTQVSNLLDGDHNLCLGLHIISAQYERRFQNSESCVFPSDC